MAGLLDLISQYGNSASNPYATQQPAQQAAASSDSTPSIPISTLIDMLGKGASNPYANASQSSGISNDPQIIPISADEAARAQAQQQSPEAVAAQTAAQQNAQTQQAQAKQQVAQAAAQAVQQQAQQNPQQGGPALQSASVPDTSVATVNTDSSFPSPSDYQPDGSQQSQGGLLTSLAGVGQKAASDPVAAKGLLSQLGDYAQNVGSKLKNMSPAASQALIASGMTMLASNDGTRNLTQLIGQGGIAGINQYQSVNQVAAQNMLARQKLEQDLMEKQAANRVAQQQADTATFKAANTPTAVKPGESITTPGMIASGQAPQTVSGPNGALPVARTAEITDGNGNTYTQGYDMWGRPVGAPAPKTLAYTGPVTSDQQKTINDAQTAAATDQKALQRTMGLMSQLQNVNIPQGLAAKGQDMWTQLTGDQSTGQILRNELQQQTYQNYLATWKPGIGGRLTNTDVSLLQKGMPPDTAGSAAWTKFLTAYGKLQADVADQSSRQAAYVAQNRGDMSPLRQPLTFNGTTFPAGTTYAQVASGQGGTTDSQGGQNSGAQGAAPTQSALIAEAKRRGLKQDANGKWYQP